MAYVDFSPAKPDIADDGDIVINNMRENLMALRDSVISGASKDWNLAVSGGTSTEPTQLLYTKSSESVRLTVTWGTSGGADGNPITVVYAADDGTGFETIGTWAGTYDSSGNLTSEVWS